MRGVGGGEGEGGVGGGEGEGGLVKVRGRGRWRVASWLAALASLRARRRLCMAA